MEHMCNRHGPFPAPVVIGMGFICDVLAYQLFIALWILTDLELARETCLSSPGLTQ
jgi:hypothetical protein